MELLAYEKYKKFGNVDKFPMAFKAVNNSSGQGFTEYSSHRNIVGQPSAVVLRKTAKQRLLEKLGAAKGQTHIGDFVKK